VGHLAAPATEAAQADLERGAEARTKGRLEGDEGDRPIAVETAS
jgi:hypothetical protein